MSKKFLIINIGSASKKYALFSEGKILVSSHYEKDGSGGFFVSHKFNGSENGETIAQNKFENSAASEIEFLLSQKMISRLEDIVAAGFRVVAPGKYFAEPRIIDEEYEIKLRESENIAPIHVSAIAEEIKRFRSFFPSIRAMGFSDSAFHDSMPETSATYALPKNEALKFGLRRYGYHGISLASAMRKIGSRFSKLPEKIIICHLGSGASITAVKNGKSFDTSMGLTPMEGLVMSTRSGDLDPGAVLALGRFMNLNYDELSEILNKKSGLLGISNRSEDIRELLIAAKEGDKDCALALDVFVYRIKKYIGAYAAALGGIDLLVFTGTAGERSHFLRKKILEGMEFLGLRMDEQKSRKCSDENPKAEFDDFIESENSSVKIAVFKSQETEEIARQLEEIFSE